jgi:hypothetical protein
MKSHPAQDRERLDPETPTRIRVTDPSFIIGNGRSPGLGELLTLPLHEARDLIARRLAEPV